MISFFFDGPYSNLPKLPNMPNAVYIPNAVQRLKPKGNVYEIIE